jgi:hypothetical protein
MSASNAGLIALGHNDEIAAAHKAFGQQLSDSNHPLTCFAANENIQAGTPSLFYISFKDFFVAFTITAGANNEAQRLRELFQNATEPTEFAEFTKVWVYRAAPQSVAAKSYTPTAELHWKLKQTSISQFLLKIDFCLC